MKPCEHQAPIIIPGTVIPITLTCALAQGHKGSHSASFTFNGVYAEAEWLSNKNDNLSITAKEK